MRLPRVLHPAGLLIASLAMVAGCDGNIGDVFSIYPPRVFNPDAGGDGGGGGGGGATLVEVASIESNGGVVGDVRNIVVAPIGSRKIAFVTAGTGGVHLIDVTKPDMVNTTSRIATISDATLSDAGASLAGGRADALAVVDNTWLVSIAVGTSATNAVSVFNINTILTTADSGGSDFSAAFVAPATGSEIAVPGTAGGKGGGVSGANAIFMVATGGPELAGGVVIPGTPATWTAIPPLSSAASPAVDAFVDVEFASLGLGGVVYASVRSGQKFGIVAATFSLGDPPSLTITTPDVIEIEGDFSLLLSDRFVGPGNFPPALAMDQLNLYATGDDEVHVFSLATPGQPASPSIVQGTGIQTIAVAATTGQFAVGAGTSVRIFTTTGASQQIARLDLSGTFTARGVAFVSADSQTYLLVCSGTRGVRVLRFGISGLP